MSMNTRSSLTLAKDLSLGVGLLYGMQVAEVILHESAHLAAMRILFTNINPFITLSPDGLAGYCNYGRGKDSRLRAGLPISKDTAFGFVSAAGPLATIASTACSSIVAWKMRASNSKICSLFAAHAIITSFNLFEYSTWPTEDGDFALVEKYLGVPHNAQTAVIGFIWFSTIVFGTALGIYHFKKMEKERIEGLYDQNSNLQEKKVINLSPVIDEDLTETTVHMPFF